MASAARHLFADLSGPGPHQVMRGDLALAGLPGMVFTPRSGRGLPAIAFGHGWLQPAQRYRGLLHHLASWGIVAAAPATQQGPLGSHRLHAGDLGTALDVCVNLRLGDGEISIDRDRLGLAGHSTGAVPRSWPRPTTTGTGPSPRSRRPRPARPLPRPPPAATCPACCSPVART